MLLTKKLSFAVEKAELFGEETDSQFATARIQAFNTGRSLHNTLCDFETLKKTAPTIYEKPIIWEYDKNLGDFGTHNPNTTVPAGFIVPDSAEFEEMPDGRISLNVFAKIWKRYSGKFLDIFKNTGTNNKSVSVEMEVKDYRDESDGAMNLLDFVYSAVCVLGDYVTEASPGANMEMLSFAKNEQSEYEAALVAEFASRYDELDFKIPENIKKNAQDGLDLYAKHKKGGTSVALSVARFLAKSDVATPEKVRHVAKYFLNHAGDSLDDKTNKYWIGWQLRGGNEAVSWSKKLVDYMNKIDERKMSYFAQEGDAKMPYEKIGDINPALKGITPPISLGQANAIAKQADAIGTDEKKNGWAIAISSFKKTHTVKDGKWVAKSSEASMAFEYGEDLEYAKEDLGKGEALKVDKSKDAMSTSPWGDVDKIALRNKVLGASNYKSLVDDVYLVVEAGWEDAPSGKLKYPVMQVKGDTLVYNRYGLSSALQRAEGQNQSSAISKAKGIYKKLGLEDKENMAEKEEKDKMALPPKEGEPMPKIENAAPAEGSKEEEKKESPAEEKKEQEEGKGDKYSFADAEYASKLIAYMEEEPEDAKMKMAADEMKKGKEADFGLMMEGMYAKMCKMSEKMAQMSDEKKVFEAEMAALKEFKASMEAKEKEFAVSETLRELDSKVVIPDDARKEMLEEAKKFSFAEIDVWKNNCKAKAFSFAIKTDKKDEGDKHIHIGLPFHSPASQKSIWKLGK
jgi:hypothetical protein